MAQTKKRNEVRIIDIDNAIFNKLKDLSKKENRHIHQQAKHLLEEALNKLK